MLQKELKPGKWKFSFQCGSEDVNQEEVQLQSIWISKADLYCKFYNILQNLIATNPILWDSWQNMTVFKKDKLKEGILKLSECILNQTQQCVGWGEEGDHFGYGLEQSQAQQIQACPVTWFSACFLDHQNPLSGIRSFEYQSGQTHNEDLTYCRVYIQYQFGQS